MKDNHKNLKKLNKKETKQSIIDLLTIEANNGIKSEVSGIDAVKFRMEQYGLNEHEFSGIIGITESEMTSFLMGKIKIPRKAIVRCVAIGVSVNALLSDM